VSCPLRNWQNYLSGELPDANPKIFQPAEQAASSPEPKAMEIIAGAEAEPEITEIITGWENITKRLLIDFSRARQRMDSCCDSMGPEVVVRFLPLYAAQDFVNKGGKIRMVTEINADNLAYVKELMKTHQIRHLQGIRANFGLSERDFSAPTFANYPMEVPQFVFSRSKGLIRQHQYIFETLWEKAIPAEERIREIEEGIEPEITEIVTGWENIFKRNVDNFAKAIRRVDSCCDALVPPIIVNSPMHKASIDFVNRGGKIRIITEITPDNLTSIKELMKTTEIRHIDGFKLNLGVSENTFSAPTSIYSVSSNPQCIYSNSKEVIKEHQYLFETLWNKAIPAELKIMQIEEGKVPEITEVWRDESIVISKSLEVLKNLKKKYDFCIDWKGPSIIMSIDFIHKAYLDIVARGGKLRLITEITPDNISYCKQITSFCKVRHLDNIKGNFGIVDEKIYGGTATTMEKRNPTSYIHSTVKEFVDQQQYFFETLWEKAIPAEERIKQLEEGKRPEITEIIHDTEKSIARAFEVMDRTKEELLVLFATPRTFALAMTMEPARMYRKISESGGIVRILVPRGEDELLQRSLAEIRQAAPLVDIRLSSADLNTSMTVLISDRKEFMSWQLKDDKVNDPYMAGGVATYSNIEPLASSYAIIFENLWRITEFSESLRTANIKLENNEKAMKEFIDITAHELRNPIQPILGLSQLLRDRDEFPEQKKLLGVIVRNAERLDKLAEDILDITRIESGKLQLSMKKIDLNELVNNIAHDSQRMLSANHDNNFKKRIVVIDRIGNSAHNRQGPMEGEKSLIVMGDPNRIAQVISNLLSNAIKFTMDGGEITVVVDASNFTNGERKATISVIDQGPGIDPEVFPKLFEKFVSKSEKGLGLGLYLSKKIAIAHGGDIFAKNNKDGKGATFTFSMPMVAIS
jgi:two-component system sensor histidine kinase VicK